MNHRRSALHYQSEELKPWRIDLSRNSISNICSIFVCIMEFNLNLNSTCAMCGNSQKISKQKWIQPEHPQSCKKKEKSRSNRITSSRLKKLHARHQSLYTTYSMFTTLFDNFRRKEKMHVAFLEFTLGCASFGICFSNIFTYHYRTEHQLQQTAKTILLY